MQPNSRKLAALLKHTKLMPPPVKQRREGTMGKKLMVCLEGKKVETKKKLSKKKQHFNETCLEQFEGTEKIVKYRLRLC